MAVSDSGLWQLYGARFAYDTRDPYLEESDIFQVERREEMRASLIHQYEAIGRNRRKLDGLRAALVAL